MTAAPAGPIAFWCSDLLDRRSKPFFGRAWSYGEAFGRCEHDCSAVLLWREVEPGQWSAQVGSVVYTVRYEQDAHSTFPDVMSTLLETSNAI